MEWAFPRQHILKNSTPPTFPYSRTVVPNPAATSSSIRDFEIIFIYFGLHVRFRVRIAYYAEFKTTYIYIYKYKYYIIYITYGYAAVMQTYEISTQNINTYGISPLCLYLPFYSTYDGYTKFLYRMGYPFLPPSIGPIGR